MTGKLTSFFMETFEAMLILCLTVYKSDKQISKRKISWQRMSIFKLPKPASSPGCIAQLVMCLAADMCLTADPRVASLILASPIL